MSRWALRVSDVAAAPSDVGQGENEDVAVLKRTVGVVGRDDDVLGREQISKSGYPSSSKVRNSLSSLGRCRSQKDQAAACPLAPRGAPASTLPVKASWPWLDVSTNPPSPLLAPPLARMVPAKVVWLSDHSTTLPPWPRPVADALIVGLRVDAHGGRGRDGEVFELGARIGDEAQVRMAAAPVAADQDLAAAAAAGRVDLGIGDLDVLAAHHDRAAGRAAVLARRRDRAGELDGLRRSARRLAAAGGGVEHDHAVVAADRVGPDHALGVDDGIDHRARRRGGELDPPAVGADDGRSWCC